ncbi:MAG TPA: hypothetical protein VF885_25970 [Arthrobacter sp.]
MAIPAGISTALVHLDAPISFIGDPGQLHVTIKSSVPLVWAATGTPLANFIDNINPGEGTELAVELPHTDQPGFLDGNGNTFTGWSYVVEIVYEKSGEQVHFPTREFQILTGQDSVDLALVPAGESYVPVVAPILPVTSLEGFTGAVTLTQLQLDLVDNTPDLAKPVSTATQAALDTLTANANSRILRPADPNADRILFWDDSAGAYVSLVHAAPLNITGTTLSITAATGAAAGTMSAADKAKLDAATGDATPSTVVMRYSTGASNFSKVFITDTPVAPGEATRKDYVDNKVAAVTYGTLGVVPTSSLPPLAINEVFAPVADQAAMLALTAQRGDMAIRSDNGRTYVLSTDSPATLADWKEVMAAGQVQSVAGKTGVVALVKADVGLANVDNTADTAKPVSTAQQSALNLKANAANPAFTGTPTGLAKAHVGLGNVDNTSDANKPVSTAQAAEDAKLAKGRLWLNRVNTNSGNISALVVVSNLATFTFKANRKYRIVWDTDWIASTGNVAAAFWIGTCAVGDAAANTAVTQIAVRDAQAPVGSISAPAMVTAYYEPTVDTTVQIKFLAQTDGTGGTMIVQGNRAGGSVYAIFDDGMQY